MAKPKVSYTVRVPQIRILKALAKAGESGLTRAQIATKAKVSPSMTANLGPIHLDDIKKVNERYGKKCLIGQKLVESCPNEEGPTHYRITQAGLSVLQSI